MELSLLKFHDSGPYSASVRLAAVIVFIYAGLKYLEAKRSPLNAIPTVGHSGVLTSYITAFKWLFSAGDLVKDGYIRYHGRPFKVATMSRWVVALSGKQAVEDIRKASDDTISFRAAVSEMFQMKYTLGRAFHESTYHIQTVRSPVTRNLVGRFDDIRDEIVESFKDYIPCKDEWVTVPAYETLMHVVCRTSNRYFVGLPVCRNPGYLALNENFAVHVVLGSTAVNCVPDFLKPLVGRYMTTIPKTVREAIGYLGPTLEDRLAKDKEYGLNWAGRPNDLISWLLETAPEDLRTIRDLTLRILTINFGAIHTSTSSLTNSLFDLAVHPECVAEMREEAEMAIAELGWTKAAMQKMRKVDSFLKESQRLNALVSMNMNRKVLRDWTLSDGTLLPAGTIFGIATDAMSKEEELFPDALAFKGFRFAEMREGDGVLDNAKHQMVSLNMDHIMFGHGRHACPGRFFAVNEIKAIFAHILLNYDVQLEGGSLERPKNTTFLVAMTPSRKVKVMFRKRAAL